MIRTVSLLLIVLCCLAAALAIGAPQPPKAQGPIKTRFTDNVDGTVLDRITGLTWIPRLKIEASNLKEAKALCSRLEYAGQKNWRLPTKDELVEMLASLKSKEEQVLFSAITRAEPSTLFWTSSLYVEDPNERGGVVQSWTRLGEVRFVKDPNNPGGLVPQNLGPNPFVETVRPNGGVVIHGGAEGPGVYFILVHDKNPSPEKKNSVSHQEKK